MEPKHLRSSISEGRLLAHPQAFAPKHDPLASHEWFKKWEGTRLGHRGADYDALKEMFRDRILEGLFEHYPQCRGRVTHTSVGTSLSFNHYLGVRSGEVYGLGSTGDRYNPTGDIAPWLRPQVPGVSGLYQTGVDTLMIGFTKE